MGIESDWTSLQKNKQTHHPVTIMIHPIPRIVFDLHIDQKRPRQTARIFPYVRLRAPGWRRANSQWRSWPPHRWPTSPCPGPQRDLAVTVATRALRLFRWFRCVGTCRAGCACGTRWTKPSRLPESMCFGDEKTQGWAVGWCLELSWYFARVCIPLSTF